MRIKVLHLIASTDFGGAEQVLLNMCKSLTGKNIDFEVGLFVMAEKMHEHALGNILSSFYIPRHFVHMRLPYFYSEIFELTRIYKRRKINIVHCHGFRSDVLGGLSAKICKIPTVSSVHGWIVTSKKMGAYKWLDLMALRHFNAVLPVSKELEIELVKNKVKPSKIHLLRNVPGKPPELIGPVQKCRQSDICHLGFLGRLSNEKGVDYLLECLSEISETASFHLHIAGDGPERFRLEEKTKKLSIDDNVTFYGHVNNPYEFFTKINILILPSLTEGTPMSLLEAMSFGLPIVASKVGGVPEIIMDNNSGLLFAPGNKTALKNRLLTLMLDSKLQNKLSNGARQSVAKICNHDVWRNKLINIYENLV